MLKFKRKFKRGQKVMLLEEYRSYPKLSTSSLIPAGLILTVVKTLPPDFLNPEPWVIVKRLQPKDYDLSLPENKLVPYDPLLKYLYGK